MAERTEAHVKVLFYVEQDDGSYEVESLWAVPEANGHRLDNIPWFARGFAWGDVVATTPDPDGPLRVTGLVAASGHSTVRIVAFDSADVKRLRDELRAMGCDSELYETRLFAVDIPPDVPYAPIRDYLERAESAGTLEYEEGCLAQP